VNDGIKRKVAVEVPTTTPQEKTARLTLDGDDVVLALPVSLRTPKMKLSALERAVQELRAMAGEHS
jgi:hypothetical protein